MKIQEILHYVTNFIFPKHCVICDELLPFGVGINSDFLCEKCKDKLEFIEEPTCKKCGAKIYEKDEGLCDICNEKIKANNSYFEYGFGLLRYNNFVKESIHRIKYNSKKEYIEFYAKMLARVFHENIKQINPDCFVPVPIHKDRERERGYNQSLVLADILSKELRKYDIDVPVNVHLITREKKTMALNKLSTNERQIELNNAFFVDNSDGKKRVMIVDDIYTTGTTIETMSKILKENGVRESFFVCIAVVDNT